MKLKDFFNGLVDARLTDFHVRHMDLKRQTQKKKK